MKILITGGTGLIGSALIEKILSETSHSVIALTRRPEKKTPFPQTERVHFAFWDGETPPSMSPLFEDIEAVIHLAGEPVFDHPWTPAQKEKILKSRVHSTRSLTRWASEHLPSLRAWLNGSAVGYYGSSLHQEWDEASPAGTGFLPSVCMAWEEAASSIPRTRTVLLRTGLVLSPISGILKKMILPFRLFMGGPLGNKNSWLPWVHLNDTASAILFCLQNNSLEGPVNITAPHPETMDSFCRILAKAMKRPSWFHLPETCLRWTLGEKAELVLSSQKVLPRKLEKARFQFYFPHASQAIASFSEFF